MTRTLAARRSPRLTVEALEAREVPANNLTLTVGTTSHVTQSTIGNTTTFATNGADAQLSLALIQNAGNTAGITHIVITTAVAAAGTNANQPGNLVWDNSTAGTLDPTAMNGGITITFQTVAGTGAVGNITLTGVSFDDFGSGAGDSLTFDSSAANGAINFVSDGFTSLFTSSTAVRDLTVAAGTGAVTYDASGSDQAATSGVVAVSGGAVTLNSTSGIQSGTTLGVTGTAITLGGTTLFAGTGLTLIGPVTLTGDTSLFASAPSTIGGSVNGAFGLTVSGTTTTLGGVIGGTTPLTSLLVEGGEFKAGSNAIHATSVQIGANFGNPSTVLLSSTGAVTGDVDVESDGALAPGGVGTVGTLPITGNLTFNSGTLALDLGATSDKVTVTGNVTINGGTLGGPLGSGVLAGPGDVQVIGFGGTLTGAFDNAPLNTPALVGNDAVEVTHYGPAATGVTIAQVAKAPGGVVTGSDNDGTGFTVKVTGGGDLVAATDGLGSRFMVVRNATPTTQVKVTTTNNASDDFVSFDGGIVVNGTGLKTFSAPTTDAGGRFAITGPAKTIVLHTYAGNGMTLGGAVADQTSIKANFFNGTLTAGSTLSAVTMPQGFNGNISAPAAKTMKLGSFVGQMTFAGALTSLTVADAILSSTITAAGIGTIAAKTVSNSFVNATTGALGAVKIAGSLDTGMLSGASLGKVQAGSVSAETLSTAGALASVAVAGNFDGTVTAGSLGKFTARSINLGTFGITGAIASIASAGDFAGSIGAGSIDEVSAAGLGNLTVSAAGNLESLSVGLGLSAQVTAASVGSIKTGGALDGFPGDWTVTGGIGSIQAVSIDDLVVNAKFVGSVTATGAVPPPGHAGSIDTVTFNLSGDDGSNAKYGLKSLTAKGSVSNSAFNVHQGNVGTVTVGRFLDSALLLNYSSALPFNTAPFDSATNFKLASFTTTATTINDPNNPVNYAYQRSEIAADTIGTISLSGLKTASGGPAFGIKFHTAGGSVKVASADNVAIPLNTNLTPSASALAGKFFFVGV